jgi:hypothetical protein
MAIERLYLGVDVGASTARAALFDGAGVVRGVASHPTRLERPREDFVEQSSDDIWAARGAVVRGVLTQARATPENVAGDRLRCHPLAGRARLARSPRHGEPHRGRYLERGTSLSIP